MSETDGRGAVAAWVAYLRDIGVRELAVPTLGTAAAAIESASPAAGATLFAAGTPASGSSAGDAAGALQTIRDEIGECTRCRLHEKRQNIVFGVGDPAARLMFVGEGPGADEDVRGEPFVGRAGQKLDQMIEPDQPDDWTGNSNT